MRKLFILANLLLYSSLIMRPSSASPGPQKTKVCISGACVSAEVASSDYERQMGLMFREGLGEDSGMLFVYPEEGEFAFWMLNMKFPIDIIWISKDKKVVAIAEEAAPCKESCEPVNPAAKAQYVLEVEAGFCQKFGVSLGDRAEFE